jgi:hypothetical protein
MDVDLTTVISIAFCGEFDMARGVRKPSMGK